MQRDWKFSYVNRLSLIQLAKNIELDFFLKPQMYVIPSMKERFGFFFSTAFYISHVTFQNVFQATINES